MAKLGFLGLGIMGGPMARHLVTGGHEVAVWSNNQKKAKALADSAGALFCATPAEVAQNSECAFLCVGDTAMSRAHLFVVTAILGCLLPPGSAAANQPETPAMAAAKVSMTAQLVNRMLSFFGAKLKSDQAVRQFEEGPFVS